MVLFNRGRNFGGQLASSMVDYQLTIPASLSKICFIGQVQQVLIAPYKPSRVPMVGMQGKEKETIKLYIREIHIFVAKIKSSNDTTIISLQSGLLSLYPIGTSAICPKFFLSISI